MIQTVKLVKVYVYLKGKRHEIEPNEARSLLAQLQAALGTPAQVQQVFIPVPQPVTPPLTMWPPDITWGIAQ